MKNILIRFITHKGYEVEYKLPARVWYHKAISSCVHDLLPNDLIVDDIYKIEVIPYD